jgi:hypothetical protein
VQPSSKSLFYIDLACGNIPYVTAALGIVHATHFPAFGEWGVFAYLFDNLFVPRSCEGASKQFDWRIS